jgi:hypothetical protein
VNFFSLKAKIVFEIIFYQIFICRYDDIGPRNGTEQQKQCIEALLLGDAPFRKFMRPEFIRLAPPLHVAQDEVLEFLNLSKLS